LIFYLEAFAITVYQEPLIKLTGTGKCLTAILWIQQLPGYGIILVFTREKFLIMLLSSTSEYLVINGEDESSTLF